MEDQRTEQWLNSEGVTWEYLPSVAMEEIDLEASKRNQARVNGALIDDLVERYALSLIDGMKLPAVIAWRADSGRLVLLDGNQRCAANIDVGNNIIDVYLCSGLDEQKRTGICWSANGTLNGDAGSSLDRLLQAKAFHKRYPGLPNSEVARRFRIKPEKFDRELRNDDVSTKLTEYGLDPETITATNKDRLHSYLNMEVQFREGAKLLQESGMKGQMAAEFWSDLRRAKTERDAMAVIDAWRERQDVQELIRSKRFNRPHVPKSNIQHFIDRLKGLRRFLERYPDLVALEVASHEEVMIAIAEYKGLSPFLNTLLRESQSVRAA